MSRRSVIVGGIPLAATLSLARQSAGYRIMFGVNRDYYDRFTAAIPLARAVRIYYDAENVFPQAWPAALPGAWATVSIRPNPDDLLSGRLDAALQALIQSAPAHSELAIWHEATPGNPLGYPSYVNARSVTAMQTHMQRLCRGTRVRFGSIICGPADQMADWIAPGLDWYATDQYDNRRFWNRDGTLERAAIFARMDTNLAVWRAKSGVRHPPVRVCETNSPLDSHRKNWLTYLGQWMAANNGSRILTYWNPGHGLANSGLSGPWPPSAGVVRQLRSLSEQYRG